MGNHRGREAQGKFDWETKEKWRAGDWKTGRLE